MGESQEKSSSSSMNEYLVPLRTPCVYFDPQFLSESEATEAYEDLLKNTPWEKTPKINRWVTLMELPKDNNNDDANGSSTGKKEGDDQDQEGSGYRYRDAPGDSQD
ncbi:hypothetical protein ACHAXR_012770 [Thalassiosira sp. AJA248-18]